uniref:CRIB domain-containing protein n=1 Tax=Phasianus colchicus TaxID=9054 RepID=A0A669PQD2_PHACC
MPILKQLVSNSAHSKRRSRADLTAEMISAPLGDFRHTMHVGRAGDQCHTPYGPGTNCAGDTKRTVGLCPGDECLGPPPVQHAGGCCRGAVLVQVDGRKRFYTMYVKM